MGSCPIVGEVGVGPLCWGCIVAGWGVKIFLRRKCGGVYGFLGRSGCEVCGSVGVSGGLRMVLGFGGFDCILGGADGSLVKGDFRFVSGCRGRFP